MTTKQLHSSWIQTTHVTTVIGPVLVSSCFKCFNQRICIVSEIFYLKNTATVCATVKQCLNHHILLPPV